MLKLWKKTEVVALKTKGAIEEAGFSEVLLIATLQSKLHNPSQHLLFKTIPLKRITEIPLARLQSEYYWSESIPKLALPGTTKETGKSQGFGYNKDHIKIGTVAESKAGVEFTIAVNTKQCVFCSFQFKHTDQGDFTTSMWVMWWCWWWWYNIILATKLHIFSNYTTDPSPFSSILCLHIKYAEKVGCILREGHKTGTKLGCCYASINSCQLRSGCRETSRERTRITYPQGH